MSFLDVFSLVFFSLVMLWLCSVGNVGRKNVTRQCPLLMGVTTAAVDPHLIVTYSHIWTHRLGSMNECFFSTHAAKHFSVVWKRETYTCRKKKRDVRELEVSMCVWKSLGRNLCWQHVCECERGPLVLSDRGIRSEGGIYLSLSDSLRLVSCSAARSGCSVRKQPLGREKGKTVALTRK